MQKNTTSSFSCMTLRDQKVAYVMPGKINFNLALCCITFVVSFPLSPLSLPIYASLCEQNYFHRHFFCPAQIVFGTMFNVLKMFGKL